MIRHNEISEKELSKSTQLLMCTIGKNIRIERMKIGMSRVELAFYAKTTESVVCNIENGKKSGISIYTLVKITQALDVGLSNLFEVEKE